MTCRGCAYDVEIERLCIQGRFDVDIEPESHTCRLQPTRILLLTPVMLAAPKHIGRPFVFDEFGMFAEYLSRVTYVERSGLDEASMNRDKASVGGLVCGSFKDNHRKKAAFVETRVLSLDFDGIGIDDVASIVEGTSACGHETFKSREGDPRCRLYVETAEPIRDLATFDKAHAIVRKHFANQGAVADESAKDVSRLNYLPVRAVGSTYGFRRIEGAPLDIARMLSVQPPPAPRTAPAFPPLPGRHEKYLAAAVEGERSKVAGASPGARHLALLRGAHALARFSLSEDEIADALIPAFVHAAGEARRREAERAVRDAVAQRKGAA